MATKRWLGGAQSVKDVWTLTLSGTVTSQTYTVTVGAKTITYTADGSATVAIIMAALLALWNDTSNPVPAEFKELVATGGVTNLVLIGTKTGVPHTVSFTTSGGSSPVSTNTTAASGPNFFNVGANWSGGVAPANSDVLVYDSGSIVCCYGLDTILTGLTINVNTGYSGQIGLPDRNTDATPYQEYRTSSLVIDGGTLVVDAPQVNLVRVNFGSTLATVRVLNSGSGLNSAPAVLVTGGAASSEADITKGSFAAAFYAVETANFPTVKMGYVSNQASDAQVTLGVGCVVTTIAKAGGVLNLYHSATTLTQDANAGTTNLFDAVALTTLNLNGGTCNASTTGTIATINVRNDGKLNFNSDPRAKTVTNPINVYGPNAFVYDDAKTVNSSVLSVVTVGTPGGNISHGLSNTISLT